jgi:hypothetical protein
MPDSLKGVTPVGGTNDADVPKGPVVVFTGAHLRCPCSPKDLQEIAHFDRQRSVTCARCKLEYDLPVVSYRWPPTANIRRA